MIFCELGTTGFWVSKMCLGTLTMGPLQKRLPVDEGAAIIKRAYEIGVNFYDTAEIYDNYEYIRRAGLPAHETYIATKSYAYDRKTAERSLTKYLRETGRERAEIMMLHEQESMYTIEGHLEAIEYYMEKQREGLVGALGLSTHHVAAVRAALKHDEIDVIQPIINERGLGIVDGTREEMESAICDAYHRCKGVYAMKPLGGGHMIGRRESALTYINSLFGLSSVAIGVSDLDELYYNVAWFSGKTPDEGAARRTALKERRMIVQDWCAGCGACVSACASKAINIVDGKAVCDMDKCVFCGYCGAACKEAAIKVV